MHEEERGEAGGNETVGTSLGRQWGATAVGSVGPDGIRLASWNTISVTAVVRGASRGQEWRRSWPWWPWGWNGSPPSGLPHCAWVGFGMSKDTGTP